MSKTTFQWSTGLLAAALLWSADAVAGRVLYVNSSDPSCGGATPCFTKVQAAVAAAGSGDLVQVQEGVYSELVRISGKADLVVEGDPARPPGSASIRPSIQPALEDCLLGTAAIEVERSTGITLRRLMVDDYEGYGLRLIGAPEARILGMRLVGNGRSQCGGGVVIEGSSPGTILAHNVIHANHRDGVVFRGASTPDATDSQYLWSNTIYGNGRHGVLVASVQKLLFWNNLIVGNGSDRSLEPSFGIVRDVTEVTAPLAGSEVALWNNLICGNRSGEVVLDALETLTASGNLTPSGDEGSGYASRPNCADPAALFDNGPGRDSMWGTRDDNFFLRETSPAAGAGHSLPHGLDEETLRADFYESRIVRPAPNVGGVFNYDIGALEWGPRTRRNLPPHLVHVRRVPESMWLE